MLAKINILLLYLFGTLLAIVGIIVAGVIPGSIVLWIFWHFYALPIFNITHELSIIHAMVLILVWNSTLQRNNCQDYQRTQRYKEYMEKWKAIAKSKDINKGGRLMILAKKYDDVSFEASFKRIKERYIQSAIIAIVLIVLHFLIH